jgi:hypothetical protein
VWALIFQKLDLLFLAPDPSVTRFSGWWRRTIAAAPKEMRKGLNTLIILVAWEAWKHRNDCVFQNVRPNVQEVINAVCTEGGLWCMAGASQLAQLLSRSLPSGV